VKFTVKEKGGGYAYYFGFKENDKIKWEIKCGEVGKKGCNKEKLKPGQTLEKSITYKID
jgi:hypothetical protein